MGIHVNDLLKLAVDAKASDLHIKVGSYPMMRVRGVAGTGHRRKAAGPRRHRQHGRGGDVHAAAPEVQGRPRNRPGLQRARPGPFRCNVFQQRGTIGIVLRIIPVGVKSVEDLGLPQVLKTIAEEERGLVLVTGTTGSGKSTSLAALVDHVNTTRCAHVVTVEDPSSSCTATTGRSSTSARSRWTRGRSPTPCAARCARTPTSSSSAKCATTRPSRRRCWPPKPATSCSRRSTPSTPPRRSTASSLSFRPTSRSRSACSWRAC